MDLVNPFPHKLNLQQTLKISEKKYWKSPQAFSQKQQIFSKWLRNDLCQNMENLYEWKLNYGKYLKHCG